MRRLLLTLAFALVVPGCSLSHWGYQATTYDWQYCQDRHASESRHRALARIALAELQCTNPRSVSSADYVRGFIDGYSDYLDMGGTGALPPVPSPKYWKAKYFTPEYEQATMLWYDGFRDGVIAAWQSGYRKYEVVPSPACCMDPGPYSSSASMPGPELSPSPEPLPPGEVQPGPTTAPQADYQS